jgi:translation initiation factor eIF-2B subunit alpha/methylthioribose-1-phosphate isomerase
MAQAAFSGRDLGEAEKILSSTRPTAFDLFDAIKYFKANYSGKSPQDVADAYADASAERCRMIGVYGAKLIREGMRLLTHCNAGALACVDWGTALAPMRVASRNGVKFSVFVDETRPRLQGAKLTAWELGEEGIEHYVIADNAAGFFMSRGGVDLVIVGADRVAVNGDFANKIGTYEKAVLARENRIPFYVAAPASTFDPKTKSGKEIEIEERSADEVNFLEKVRVTPQKTRARNPAFDVTPAKYVTGFITERGIKKPGELKRFFT